MMSLSVRLCVSENSHNEEGIGTFVQILVILLSAAVLKNGSPLSNFKPGTQHKNEYKYFECLGPPNGKQQFIQLNFIV